MPSPVEDSDAPDFMDWWILVKHPDGQDEHVQVHQIENYLPKSKTDFKFGEKYSLKTARWSKDGKVRRYKVFISRMEETPDLLRKSIAEVRPRWPILQPSESDFLTTDDDTVCEKIPPRESPAALDQLKRNAADKDLEAFASRLPEFLENECSSRTFSTSTPCSKGASKTLAASQKNSSALVKNKAAKEPTMAGFVRKLACTKSPIQATKRISETSRPCSSSFANPPKKIRTSTETGQKSTSIPTTKPSNHPSKTPESKITPRSENKTPTVPKPILNENSLESDSIEMFIEDPDGTVNSFNFNTTIEDKNRYIGQLEEEVKHWKSKAHNESEEKNSIAQQLAAMNERLGRLCEMEGEIQQIKAVLSKFSDVNSRVACWLDNCPSNCDILSGQSEL